MDIYLAANWSRRDEVREIANALVMGGVYVTARWLDEHPCPTEPLLRSKFLRETAIMDLADVRKADALVRFTAPMFATSSNAVESKSAELIPRAWATGGCMVEMGYAIALGKIIYVVGGVQNVFDHLPQIVHVADTQELIANLSFSMEVAPAR